MGRPPQPLLSQDSITAEALALIDTGAEFSMRALAKRLGVAAPSLYRHVDSRNHIVELIRVKLVSERPLPPVCAAWRDEIEQLVRTLWRTYASHPNLVPWLIQTEIGATPVLEIYDRLARALGAAGFRPRQVALYEEMLDSLAIGLGLQHLSPAEIWRADNGLDSLEAMAKSWSDPVERLEAVFDLGLRILLDGIEADAKAVGR